MPPMIAEEVIRLMSYKACNCEGLAEAWGCKKGHMIFAVSHKCTDGSFH